MRADGTIMAVQYLLNAAPSGGYYTPSMLDGSAPRLSKATVFGVSWAGLRRNCRRRAEAAMDDEALIAGLPNIGRNGFRRQSTRRRDLLLRAQAPPGQE